jgi:hypothetical protein
LLFGWKQYPETKGAATGTGAISLGDKCHDTARGEQSDSHRMLRTNVNSASGKMSSCYRPACVNSRKYANYHNENDAQAPLPFEEQP